MMELSERGKIANILLSHCRAIRVGCKSCKAEQDVVSSDLIRERNWNTLSS